MADLRIVDAPLLSTVKGTEKLPTGGEGNFSVSVNQVADFAKLKWVLATEGYVDNAVGNVQADLNLHKNNESNPHNVTKTQVGLGNVDNTADLDKPVSNATQSAIITANSGKADKSYVDSQDQLKADKTYVDSAIGAISTDASKQYATLALANADIASISINKNIFVSESVNGGYWYKATAEATSLTKSPYDPLEQAKEYTDAEITELGFQSIANEELSFSIVSNLEKRLWIEANKQGLPTAYAAQCIYNAIQSFISTLINSSLVNIGLDQVPDQTLSFTIATPAGQRIWLEADKSGLPTEWSKKCIIDAINQVNTISSTLYKSEYQSKPKKITSGRNIVCWGDSMTYGVGATTHQFPTYLKKLLSDAGSTAQVFNAGVGGESSASIAARQGANPFIVNPFTIPADKTPVTITLGKVNGLDMYPLYQGNGEGDASGGGAALRRYFDGEIAGVKGRLSLVQPSAVGTVYNRMPDDYYTFTRAESGVAVSVARPAPFYLDYAKQHYGDIHIIWVGQNNGTDQDRAIADTKAIIQKMETLDKRYLVISKPISSTETLTKVERDALDAKFFDEFGRRFIPIRQYLIEYGLQDAGITPTAQDNIDIANGQVPQSLRVDTVHFTTPAYISTAQQIFNRLNELGWI